MRSNQSVLKEISPGISLEGMMLKLKLQYFGHLIRSVDSLEKTLRMRWPKYWSFSFSIIPSKEIPGLIFRMDWLDLLAVQGTLKSVPREQLSKEESPTTALF